MAIFIYSSIVIFRKIRTIVKSYQGKNEIYS